MLSQHSIFLFVLLVDVVLLTLFVVVSSEGSLGNDVTDAGKYLGHHPANGTAEHPASRDNRAVREGEADPAQQGVDKSEPLSPFQRGNVSCTSIFMFLCRDGLECISRNFLCDKRADCRDSSDEQNCPQRKSGKCLDHEFECDNRRCIPMTWQCDGGDDCDDNSDERGCKVTCPYNEFSCRNGTCVAPASLCDGVNDCEEGEDEEHCDKAHCTSIPGYYQCGSGDCVPPTKVCDKKTDCVDSSDEGLACASVCKRSNCTEGCYQTPKGPHCSCRDGFFLQSDHVTCADENECERQHMLMCDHFCKNTNGSFTCSCHSSYTLQEDGVTCKHKLLGDAFLLVAQQGSIRQLFLDGSRYTQIYSGGNRSVVGLGFDPVTREVYWGTRRRILAAPLKESALPRTVLDIGMEMAEGLAVDWTARNLYIADPRKFHILVCALDGSACHQVLTSLGHPRAIQLDMKNRYMYWTDVKHRSISKAGMDGSQPSVVVQDGLAWPNGMALDVPAGRLYWLDALTDEAHTARLDGTGRKTLHLATLKHPYALALWEDRLYWTDWTQNHIVSCVKRDGKHVKTELKGTRKQQYYGLVLYHPAMMEKIDNPCSYARCSHLCLLSPLSPGYTCACPTGVMQLHQDKHTCIDLPDRMSMIISSLRKLYFVSPHSFGLLDQRSWMSNLQIMEIGDVEYFPGQDLVFVSDQYSAKIYLKDMKTNAVTILVNSTVARRMALDWLRHNLYWLDSEYQVQVMRLIAGKGGPRAAVLKNLSAPLDIVVSPAAGLMFVSSTSTGPLSQAYIRRCGLDGRECHDLVSTQIRVPFSLAVDHNNYLYWCDYSLRRIERIDFHGTKRTIIVQPAQQSLPSGVLSLIITGDFLSWTVEYERSFFTMSIDNFTSGSVEITELNLDPQEAESLKLTSVKWELPKEMTEQQRPCLNNGGCSEICVGNPLHEEICLCGFSSELGSDGKTCEKHRCAEHMFECVSTSRCIPASFKCDGSPDCSDGSDEDGCPFSCKGNDYHQCGTTEVCILRSQLCDNKQDCADGSDEVDCLGKSCPDDHLCDTDKCLPQPFVCDGHYDCDDKSDESNCTHITCATGQVNCKNGMCVSQVWVCDGDKDCLDGSDEEYCTPCSAGQFPCDNKCIAVNATCDGKKDCDDGKDEAKWMCDAQEKHSCPEGKQPCLLDTSTASLVCFGHEEQCNGVLDCPRGEDESHHFCRHCKSGEFRCPTNNYCIPHSYLCDKEIDCVDGADEGEAANCTVATTTTTTTTLQPFVPKGSLLRCGGDFLCEDGECVPYSKVCDGKRDCHDGSDEQQSCELRCDVKRCQHTCRTSPTMAYCSCNRGYHLAPDERSCLDDEECKNEGICSHGCEEQKGSYRCTCLPGYRLLVDRTTCKREAGEDWLAVAVHQGILNYTHTHQLQGVSSSPPSVMFASVTSFAVDSVTGDIFFSDERRKVVSKLTRFRNGELKEEVFLERSSPRSLCFDPRQRNLYVAEFFGGPEVRHERQERSVGGNKNQGDPTTNFWSSIMACNVEGKGCSLVFGTNVSVVMSVAVAVTEKLLFFCTRSLRDEAGQLMTSYLNGTNTKEIWGRMQSCSHIALDEAKRRVYWADVGRKTLETVTWDGGKHHYVHNQLEVWDPVGLAVVGPSVVWANRRSNLVILCPKPPRQGECSIIEHSSTFFGLFTAPLPFLSEQEECGNVSCSQLCASGGSGCLCLAGYQRSSSDPTKCEKLTTCNRHECEGGSTCEPHTAEHYVCRCPEGRLGFRCEYGGFDSKESSAAITASVVVLLLVFVILVFLYWWKRCPFTIWKRRGNGNGEQGYHFVNPAFGVIHDQPIIEAEAQPARGNANYPRVPYYHPPPYAPPPRSTSLQQNSVDSPAAKHKESQINISGDSAVASTTDSILASQQSEVSLATPYNQHLAKTGDERDLSEFDYSPFNPSKM